jgi:predicted nucleic acid-binding protein
MVAALCSWHDDYQRAVHEIDGRLDAGEVMVVAAPALVETYAVLTRLPPPHRLSPSQGLALLEASFMASGVEVVALTADAYHALLRKAPEQGTAGGRTYDAAIAACASIARADALLTFNDRHFLSLAPPGMDVVVPA